MGAGWSVGVPTGVGVADGGMVEVGEGAVLAVPVDVDSQAPIGASVSDGTDSDRGVADGQEVGMNSPWRGGLRASTTNPIPTTPTTRNAAGTTLERSSVSSLDKARSLFVVVFVLETRPRAHPVPCQAPGSPTSDAPSCGRSWLFYPVG